MIRTLLFNEAIEQEPVYALIEALDNIPEKDAIQLYFSSEGGLTDVAAILMDYLQSLEDRLILVGNFILFSGGFEVFYQYKGEKRLLPNTLGLIHQATGNYSSRELQDQQSIISIQKKQLDLKNKQLLYDYQNFLTPLEIKRYKAGQDVCFSYKRMLEIFNLS